MRLLPLALGTVIDERAVVRRFRAKDRAGYSERKNWASTGRPAERTGPVHVSSSQQTTLKGY